LELTHCLNRTSMKDLRAIAVFNHISIPDRVNRETLHACLSDKLSDTNWILNTIGELDDIEREILFQIYLEMGDIMSEDLLRTWGGDDLGVSSRLLWGQEIAPGLPSLRMKGLVFLIRNNADGKDHYIIPTSVRKIIPDESPSEGIYADSKPPHRCVNWSTGILSDVFSLVRYIETYRVRPLKDGGLSKRDQRALMKQTQHARNPQTGMDWQVYVKFVYRFARQCSLVAIQDGRLHLGIRFQQWLEKSPLEQTAELFHAWLDDDTYDEFHNLAHIRVLSAGLRNSPRIVRKTIVRFLSNLKSDQWIHLDEFMTALRRSHARFFRPLEDDRHWKIQVTDSINLPSRASDWQKIEMHLIEFFISGPLLWFGAVTLGCDSSLNPNAFLINPTGDMLLDKRDSADHGVQTLEADRIIIQPDFDVLVPENAVLSLRFMVEKMANLIMTGPVNYYKITRDSIAGALSKGLTVQQMLSFLSDVSATSVPQNVSASIEYWGEQYGKIVLKRTYLLETKDPFLMEEMKARPSVKRLMEPQIGLLHAPVNPSNLSVLLKELKKAGYLPRISSELMLKWEIAPISLQLTVDTARELLKALKVICRNDAFNSGDETISGLESIMKHLEKSLESVD
jgi:Helicase conserved C-terminal domain